MSLLSKRQNRITVSALMMCVQLSSPVFAAEKGSNRKEAPEKSEWTFEQKDVETGVSTVSLTSDAVKIVNKSRGYEIISSAPTWQIEVFRRSEKTVYSTDLKGFAYFSPLGTLNSDWTRYQHLLPIAHETNKDLKLSRYRTREHVEVSLIDNIATAPEIGLALQSYYHTPIPGLPFQSVYSFSTTKRKIDNNWLNDPSSDFAGKKEWLSTLSWKKVPYAASDFQYPVGFRPVKDQTEVIMSDRKMNTFNSLVDQITQEDAAKGRLKRQLLLRHQSAP